MSSAQRSVLTAFQRALGRELHVLQRSPGLLWQQFYNRLQWNAHARPLLEEKSEHRGTQRPWLKLRTRPSESTALLRTLTGHTASIEACAFSPDSRLLVSASEDGTLKIWNIETGEEERTLRGHHGAVRTCAFSPDGAYVLSGSDDGTAKVWDVFTGAERHTLGGHDGSPWCAFSPDGTRIASKGFRDTVIRLWDTPSGRPLASYDLPSNAGFLPANAGFDLRDDGLYGVATVTLELPVDRGAELDRERLPEGHVGYGYKPGGAKVRLQNARRVWHLISGREICLLQPFPRSARVASNTEGTRLAVASEKGLAIWNCADGRQIAAAHSSQQVHAIDFSADGSRVATAGQGMITLWTAADATQICTLRGHAGWLRVCRFSPDGARLASGGRDASVKIWDLTALSDASGLDAHSGPVLLCSFSADGEMVVSASQTGELKTWRVSSGEPIASFEGVHARAVSRDGTRAAVEEDETLSVVDARTNDVVCRFADRHPGGVDLCMFDPTGACVISSAYDGVRIWNSTSGELHVHLPRQLALISACGVSPEGSRIATGGSDGTLTMWQFWTGRRMFVCRSHTHELTVCTFSPEGRRVLTASRDHLLKLWDVWTGRELATMRGHESEVLSCAFSHDGTRVVSSSIDGTVRLWNAATGDQELVIRAHRGWIWSCAFSPDDARVISTGLQVWDSHSGECLAELPLAGGSEAIAHHPGLPVIACGDANGGIHIAELVDPV